MALPKRRHSNQRTRKRRTHYKLTLPELGRTGVCAISSQNGGTCPMYRYRLAHHACPECGFYNGKRAFVGRFFKRDHQSDTATNE